MKNFRAWYKDRAAEGVDPRFFHWANVRTEVGIFWIIGIGCIGFCFNTKGA